MAEAAVTRASTLQAPLPPRSPWQLLYAAAHRARYRWYRRRAERLPRPVVSVGNLHWGGAGKTPLVIAVAAHLRDRGAHVAVLSRGYKSQGDGARVVSTYREGPLLGPLLAGDEPVLIAGSLPGVAVVVCPERVHAGRAALQRLSPPPDLFVLDDGFSHLPLARDLDLLAFPLADPFGGGRLPPAGRLREPLAAVARADAALLTGAGADAAGARALGQALAHHGFLGRSFAAPTLAGAPQLADGSPLPAGEPVLLVSAIARPQSFRELATASGARVVAAVELADHHAYPAATLDEIRRRFAACSARAVLATAKDAVKLRGRLDLPLAELPITSVPEPAFFSWLDARLADLTSGAARR